MKSNQRIGHGYDVHCLEKNRKFTLGGIEIKHNKGAVGHSDADVLIHALCDALLGALNLGDIGKHFPDNNHNYKDIDSKILLKKVIMLCKKNNYKLVNTDMTIILQKPKISSYITKMKNVLSKIIGLENSRISIKATTTEGLGFIGREEGVAAYCVVLLESV